MGLDVLAATLETEALISTNQFSNTNAPAPKCRGIRVKVTHYGYG